MTSCNDLLYLLQVSPGEMEGFEEIKSFLAGEEDKDSDIITPFPLLTENAVESLRYRAEVSSNLCCKMLTLSNEEVLTFFLWCRMLQRVLQRFRFENHELRI